MADYKTIPGAEAYEFKYKKDYYDDWDIHQKYVQTFDAYEAMLIGQVYDSVSRSVDGAKITDSYSATLAIERSARVMGKLPEGETESVGRNDQGKAAFMDLLRQKWIYPNANSQHKFRLKLRNWQLYADVYGYMPMFYDWNVASTGYVGPDCWLWNPRNLVFQQGRASIYDMEYVTALTWVGKQFLKDRIENEANEDGWNRQALKFLLEIVENELTDVDQHKDTQVTRSRTPQATRKGICLATRYEAGEDGEWCTFAPDHSCIELRRIKNPHKNGHIPFVLKYCQPLFDSVYGLGDFQRAKPLQFARDALTNFYFKGIKMNLIPPIIANANGVLKHTVDYREGAVMLETIPNSIRRLETSTAGLATYQAAQTALTGSLLSLFGTQNAGAPGADTLNPSQGKSQRYSEPVLTPSGWTTMGKLNTGDDVVDNHGQPAQILEIHEQGVLDTYDIHFRDGSSTNSSLDHLWTVFNKSTKRHQTLTLGEMVGRTITFNDGSAHYCVDLAPAVEFPKRELPIDPYLLGLLLGDGGFSEPGSRISFTNSKEPIVSAVRELLPEGSELYSKGDRFNEFRIKGQIVDTLQAMGLKGGLAKDKFIPQDYLLSSVEDRRRLFQGLMDTDGHVQKANSDLMEYCTVSPQLADGFLDLARGLGYSTRLSIGISSAVYRGGMRVYGNKYRLFICGKKRKAVVAVEQSAPELSRCLYVDTPDHLYITKDYTLTHNTPAAISLYSDKEATRDGQSRESLELAIEELTDGFFSLVVNIGTEDIPVNLFSGDIEAIADAGLTDVMGIFTPSSVARFQANSTQTGGELQIDPKKLKGVEYRFNINPGSTEKLNKNAQLQNLESVMTTIGKFQNIFKDDPRVDVNWGEMLSSYEQLSGVRGAGKFVTVKAAPSPQEQAVMDENAQLKEQLGQATAEAGKPVQPPKAPSETLNYKDAPPDIRRQIEEQAGLIPSQDIDPVQTDQAVKHSQIESTARKDEQAAEQAQASHELQVAQAISGEQQANRQADQADTQMKQKSASKE